MTEAEICTLALGMLGKPGITSLDDDSNEARACKAFYAPVRDAVLEDHVWTFAKRQYVLTTPDATAPLFKFLYRYLLPGEVVLAHRCDNGNGDYRMDWERVGQYIHTDETTVNLEAVAKTEDSSLYSPSFCQAVAARLAAEISIPFTGNRQLQADLWQVYQQKVKDAAVRDGVQGRRERVRSDYLSTRR
jgi:hypothetical protein